MAPQQHKENNTDTCDPWITVAEAAARCPGHPHPSAVWRWHRRGIRGRDGSRVRLKAIRRGGRIYTCPSWLDAFFSELIAADLRHFEAAEGEPQTTSTRPRSASRTRRRGPHNDAADRLRMDGLLE